MLVVLVFTEWKLQCTYYSLKVAYCTADLSNYRSLQLYVISQVLDKELAIMQERIWKWMNKKLEEAILLWYLIQCGYTKDTLSARNSPQAMYTFGPVYTIVLFFIFIMQWKAKSACCTLMSYKIKAFDRVWFAGDKCHQTGHATSSCGMISYCYYSGVKQNACCPPLTSNILY